MQGERTRHQPPRPQRQGLDGVTAEMFVEPGAPSKMQRIASLQQALKTHRPPAAHQAEMAAMGSCHQSDDRRPFAVPLDAKDDPLVPPFHRNLDPRRFTIRLYNVSPKVGSSTGGLVTPFSSPCFD